MAKTRQIYNIWSLNVSEAPATGFSYSDYNNIRHNRSDLTVFDNNLVYPIERVNSFQYSLDIQRDNVAQLGSRDLIRRPIVNRPFISCSFGYYLVDIRNEKSLGFVVNYPDMTGTPILSEEICCLRNFTGAETDSRNLYLAINPSSNEDINNRISNPFVSGANISASGLYVMGFGNAYLTSYSVSASVGSFPQASVNYICNNILVTSSGSGARIPAVYPKSGNLVNDATFVIPRSETNSRLSVVRPKDIMIQILDTGFAETNDGFFAISSSGIAAQSFDMKLTLNRDDMRSIGYVMPLDRRINFPIFADIGLSVIVGDNKTVNLSDIVRQDNTYNLLISMYNNNCITNITGKTMAIQYKINNACLNRVSYSYDINSKLLANFNFTSEIDMTRQKGLFISGTLNIPTPDFPYDFLLLESNKTGFLFTEDDNLLII